MHLCCGDYVIIVWCQDYLRYLVEVLVIAKCQIYLRYLVEVPVMVGSKGGCQHSLGIAVLDLPT